MDKQIRKIKQQNRHKIKQVARACKETSKILGRCIRLLPKFSRERQVKNYLEKEAKKKGYKLAFRTIVASGKNAANPHYSKCNSNLKRGFLVIDFGVKFNGFCSDMTRTVFLGKPTKKEIKLYKKVLSVQEKSIKMLKNKNLKTIAKYARKKLGKEFIHSLGHGIGRKVHEPFTIDEKGSEKIKEGSCFTVEPGIYCKGKYGIRIEDTLAKISNKFKIFTNFPKKLVIINKKIYK